MGRSERLSDIKRSPPVKIYEKGRGKTPARIRLNGLIVADHYRYHKEQHLDHKHDPEKRNEVPPPFSQRDAGDVTEGKFSIFARKTVVFTTSSKVMPASSRTALTLGKNC
jgi:hypothetical protein